MTIFDQRGQHVTYQYNAYGNINFGAVENKAELLGELKKLQEELREAIKKEAVTGDTAVDAQYNLDKAVLEAEKPQPDKKKLGDYPTTAKSVLENVAAVGGLVAALSKAVELVGTLF
ncbi:MAG TPA: hypothetical protein PLJ78_05275 [Anaerolineae bacterium]|nr:hypothetical protein [Anaerolineae bacterium]HQK13341.1 hypothetical protein [Anaerolineae bacterium]